MKRFLVLCVAVIACYAAVTGSIAYFTDSVETTNRLASGNLHVVQHEYERVTNDNGMTVQAFTQAKQLYPAVGSANKNVDITVSGHTVKIEGGLRNYVDKIVTAENKGSLNMYVRTYIAVPSFSEEGDLAREEWIHLDINEQGYVRNTENNKWEVAAENVPNAAKWTLSDNILANQKIDGQPYDIYIATFSGMMLPDETTPPSLLGFYMDSDVTNNGNGLVFTDKDSGVEYDLGNSNNMKILVASVASQATVFADVAAAMNATYDKPTNNTYHPWLNVHFVADQDGLVAALNKKEYDTIISLSDGSYALPANLPAGLRITGAGAKVTLTIEGNTLSANDVEFDHVTFTGEVSFTGWGSFEEVVFQKKLTADCTHDTVFVDCTFESGEDIQGTNVSIVTSVPTPTPATSSATTP